MGGGGEWAGAFGNVVDKKHMAHPSPLSSEPPAVSGKVKLCKLMVKRRRDWGREKKNGCEMESIVKVRGDVN